MEYLLDTCNTLQNFKSTWKMLIMLQLKMATQGNTIHPYGPRITQTKLPLHGLDVNVALSDTISARGCLWPL